MAARRTTKKAAPKRSATRTTSTVTASVKPPPATRGATDAEGAKTRVRASKRTNVVDGQLIRDQAWEAAAKPRVGDRANRPASDLLTQPQRRLQQLADGEIAQVIDQRNACLRTLNGISVGIARKAEELSGKPTGRMSNKAVAEMLQAFLLDPQ